MNATPPSDRTRVKRLPERGKYDKKTVHSILDEGLVCHVGIAVGDQPFVIPMTYARSGDKLIMHGSAGSRLLTALQKGADVCVAVTHLDALVLARSAFHHSMNYRSVVIFGKANVIQDEDQMASVFKEFFEHVLPGRWKDVRKPNARELAQTALIEIPLDEASAKIRTGPPSDDEADYELPVWAGLLPFALTTQPAVDDPRLQAGIEQPDYLEYHLPKRDK